MRGRKRNPLNFIGQQIRRAADRSGMTDPELCDLSGISYSWLKTTTLAEYEPKWADNLRKLARWTNTPIQDFFKS